MLSFSIKMKFGGDSAEETRRRSMQVSLPNSPPIKRDYHNSIPYINHEISKNGISAMPRAILRILHWIFNPVFGPYVQRDWVSALLFFLSFHCRFGRFCFFRVVGLVISLDKKRKHHRADTHCKNQVQICKTDEGMANPTFKHFHVWPSSYLLRVADDCCTDEGTRRR